MRAADRAARDRARGGPARAHAARARRPERQGHAARTDLVRASAQTTTPSPPRRASPAAASSPSGQHLDRVRAAEVEVAAPPADDVVAHRLEPVELRRVEAALAVHVRLLDVHARRGRSPPRRRGRAPTTLRDHLHDRAAQPDRAGAADDEPRAVRRRRRPSAPSCSSAGGPARPGAPATRSYSPSMLFSWMPVPGTITPEPEPVDEESDAAFPSASTAETCVVPPAGACSARPGSAACDPRGRRGERARRRAAAARGRRGAARRRTRSSRTRVCSRITSTSAAIASAVPGAPRADALEQREPVGDQDAARGRRRVRDHLVPR